MHEADPRYVGLDVEASGDGVRRWRRTTRDRLRALRAARPAAERARHAEALAVALDALLEPAPGAVVSVYWPMQGEPDLRGWMASLVERGVTVALPEVVASGQPLVFRVWTPGARLEPGVWDIPVPVEGERVHPTVAIAPVVGFDPACYRLGNGGGYFDRTLAVLDPRPLAVGVAHPDSCLPTIFPQPHDIPMDCIVTGDGPPIRRGDASGPNAPESR